MWNTIGAGRYDIRIEKLIRFAPDPSGDFDWEQPIPVTIYIVACVTCISDRVSWL